MPTRKTLEQLKVIKPREESFSLSATLGEPLKKEGLPKSDYEDKDDMQEDPEDMPDEMDEDDDDKDDDEGREELPKEFRLVAYSGAPVLRWYGQLVIDLDGMEPEGLPMVALFDHHSDKIAGVIESFAIEDDGAIETGRFIDSKPSRFVASMLKQKVPMKASIGVTAVEVRELQAGESVVVNGREIVGQADIWVKSRVYETSFTATPADSATAATPLISEGATMPVGKEKEKQKLQDVPQEQETLTVDQPEEVPADQPEELKQQPAEVLTAQDIFEVSKQAASLGIDFSTVEKLSQNNTNKEKLQLALLEHAASKTPDISTIPHITEGASGNEKFHNAMRDGILFAQGYKFGKKNISGEPEKPAKGFENFKDYGLQTMIRECLSRSGVKDAWKMPPNRLADLAVSHARQEKFSAYGSSASTGDFPNILRDVINKNLEMAYMESNQTFRPWCPTAPPARDFRTIYGSALSEAPDLPLVGENAEYQETYMRDKQEVYRVRKYGTKVSLTWEMIVNDDLRAFTMLPTKLGDAAARKESDEVYRLLLSNPTLQEDSQQVFSTGHNNILTAAAISQDSLTQARARMRLQRGFNRDTASGTGALLNLMPAYLLVPPSLEN